VIERKQTAQLPVAWVATPGSAPDALRGAAPDSGAARPGTDGAARQPGVAGRGSAVAWTAPQGAPSANTLVGDEPRGRRGAGLGWLGAGLVLVAGGTTAAILVHDHQARPAARATDPLPANAPAPAAPAAPASGAAVPAGHLVLGDSFGRHPDGPLAGLRASTRQEWAVGGAIPPTLAAGSLSSSGAGYASIRLGIRPRSLTTRLAWSPGASTSSLTIVESRKDGDPGLAESLRLQVTPVGYALVVQDGGGAGHPLASGSWATPMVRDGHTAGQVTLLSTDTGVAVLGPDGGRQEVTDPRAQQAAGPRLLWQTDAGPAGMGGRALLQGVQARLKPPPVAP